MSLGPHAFVVAGTQQVLSSFGSFQCSHRPAVGPCCAGWHWRWFCSWLLALDREDVRLLSHHQLQGPCEGILAAEIAPATPPPRPFVQHELQLEKQSQLSVPLGFPSHSAERLSQHNYPS